MIRNTLRNKPDSTELIPISNDFIIEARDNLIFKIEVFPQYYIR